jgi:cardiolipin synthase
VTEPLREDVAAWVVAGVPLPQAMGGNAVQLLRGGDALFPAMCEAIAAARDEVWLATYIFHDDRSGRIVAQALAAAAARGVRVHVVIDGFGSKYTLSTVSQWLSGSGVWLVVYRPLRRWYSWLQPGQLRRLHQKMCTVDGETGFVGGINIIDDRHDVNHGWTDAPRLDYAVQLGGPLVASVQQATRAVWARAYLGSAWRDEARSIARSVAPVDETLRLIRGWRHRRDEQVETETLQPVRAAFLVRDNLRQRRAIEHSYVQAIRSARERLDIAVPYFYPGRVFRRALRQAARRGVQVRLLLQGKIDYRIAALAARALYDELRLHGVRIYEYKPAFLHAKVALVDGRWATVGSSNIDPLSLLLNLEANVVVDDEGFAQSLGRSLDDAFAASAEVIGRPSRGGWRSMLHRGVVAWMANVYLRLAGITGRY